MSLATLLFALGQGIPPGLIRPEYTAPQRPFTIRTLGFKPEDVKTGASVYAMEGDEDVMESGGATDFLWGGKVSFPVVKPSYPGIADDCERGFAWLKRQRADIFLVTAVCRPLGGGIPEVRGGREGRRQPLACSLAQPSLSDTVRL